MNNHNFKIPEPLLPFIRLPNNARPHSKLLLQDITDEQIEEARAICYLLGASKDHIYYDTDGDWWIRINKLNRDIGEPL